MRILQRLVPVLLLFTGTLTGCVTDYDIGTLKHREAECIGINAILNPLDAIRINLFRIKIMDGRYFSVGLQGSYVIVKEGSSVLYEGASADSILVLPQSPEPGENYSIEVSYNGLETAKANTTVPQAIDCNVSMQLVDNRYGYSKDYLVRLDSFHINKSSKSSLWITAYETNPDNSALECEELFCNNALTDRENAENYTSGVRNKWVGAVYHEKYLRVKNKNTFLLNELLFTPHAYLKWDETDKLVVQLTAANPEYDQYCKSLYRQELIKSYDDALSMMFYQPQDVYSNIEHGLGIFAGINQQTYYFDAK